MTVYSLRHRYWVPACFGVLTLLSASARGGPASSIDSIETVVVIYGENRSFDNLYGLYPGANGIPNALAKDQYKQLDRDGVTLLETLPPVWNASIAQESSLNFVSKLPNKPFLINAAPGSLGTSVTTPDLVHRFYNNQMQINGGTNNQFAAFSDAGGLAMGYYDGSSMRLWKLAQQYTLADNFFMGSFGGSFLNHFWLVCACTPSFSNAHSGALSSVDSSGIRLNMATTSPASARTGKPTYLADKSATPDYYAVNTMQPPYQPSGAAPAIGGDARLADPAAMPLPAQDSRKVKTVGDTLTAKGVHWAWYAGAWNQALADRNAIYNATAPNFQPHHQPFNYFTRFDPTTASGAAERTEHLKDYADLSKDIDNGSLPSVVFYKPQGNLNQHPGYTDVQSGDAHLADVIEKLQASPQWRHMLIIVTYDENGGFWDHVAPPKGDRWGPGSRIPTIIISPLAKKGFVDNTAYDTTSIIKFLTKRFNLEPLPGVRENAGDLTKSLL